jgi:APA family basic amino acid/polyamine antiporter
MKEDWQPKPGDRIVRPPRIKRYRLRRVLGVPALFSIGYGDVGSSIYYALGVVALVALGATPVCLAVAGIVYIFNALTYAEGSAMIPEGGGSASYARIGFNNLVSFVSGWALMLSYIATIAISAYTIPPYLGYFWAPLRESTAISTVVSMGIISLLMFINVIGIRESSRMNIGFIVIDIATQVSLIVLGFALIFTTSTLVGHMFGEGNWPPTMSQLIGGIDNYWPSVGGLVFGIALAALAFTGVESVSQHGEETRQPEKRMPQAYLLMIVVVLILFAGISIVALSAMPPTGPDGLGTDWARDPIAGIAAHLPYPWLRNIFAPLVSVLAATILLTATNAGLLGISRLGFNLGMHQQMPSALIRIHPRFRTPYISIILFSLIAIGILTSGFFVTKFFADLGSLYVFGSLLCFALAHISILSLRVKKPEMPRPFKLGLNIKIKGREIPLTAVLGAIATFGIWMVIVTTQPYSRFAGFGWMIVGLIAYYFYRRHENLPLIGVAPASGQIH